jgi:hypothetical protein
LIEHLSGNTSVKPAPTSGELKVVSLTAERQPLVFGRITEVVGTGSNVT